jgi:ketosteroid isomerase-like protein
MSQENVDLIMRHADAATRQDVEASLATLSPDVEWEDASFFSEPMRVYRGREEVRQGEALLPSHNGTVRELSTWTATCAMMLTAQGRRSDGTDRDEHRGRPSARGGLLVRH